MLTMEEIAALVELLNRAPKTAAETLWCVDLVERRLKPQAEAAAKKHFQGGSNEE